MTTRRGGAATSPRVVVVGLGPAGPELMTAAARAALDTAPAVLVRTRHHLAAEALVAGGARALDGHYESAPTFAQAYAAIVEDVVAAAHTYGSVAYGVPGSPAVLESSVAALRRDDRVSVQVVPGMSFLDLAWERLGIDPVTAHVRLVDAEEFATAAAADSGPLLVAQTWSRAICSDVKLAVESAPDEPIVVLHHLGHADERVEAIYWDDLDRVVEVDHLTCIYVPRLAEPVGAELIRLVDVVRTLRERCPWDREQTHSSLARHLLEETYELLEAIDELGDEPSPETVEHLEEELGDVLCQVVMHASIASEAGLFNLADVARVLHDKLVHRHPHVFGEPGGSAAVVARTAEQVLGRWEQAKREEKGRASITDGVPAALPALLLATKLERKAASVGLGWASTGAAAGRLENLAGELARGDASHVGELLLAAARIAAQLGADPEQELRRSAQAMRARIVETEQAALRRGATLDGLAAAERVALFEQLGDV